jgi:hypothetical protein
MDWTAIKGGLFRLLRVAASVAIAGGVVYLTNDPRFIVLSPVISGIAKYIREALKLDNIPL